MKQELLNKHILCWYLWSLAYEEKNTHTHKVRKREKKNTHHIVYYDQQLSTAIVALLLLRSSYGGKGAHLFILKYPHMHAHTQPFFLCVVVLLLLLLLFPILPHSLTRSVCIGSPLSFFFVALKRFVLPLSLYNNFFLCVCISIL